MEKDMGGNVRIRLVIEDRLLDVHTDSRSFMDTIMTGAEIVCLAHEGITHGS